MKTALVLEGGAVRGIFTAGVLDCFLDEKINVDAIIGVSAGALFGVNFPSQQRGRALRYNLKYLNDPRYISLQSLLKTGNIVNKDFAFYELPFTLDPFNNETFKQSPIKFYVTVTNIITGQAEYLPIHDVFAQMEAFRATSSMPYVSKFIEINGSYYLDGALSDSIPVKKAQSLGYDKIIAVLTRPLTYRKSKPPEFVAKLYYRRYPTLIEKINTRYQQYNQQVEEVIRLEQAGNIFVIRPSQDLAVKRIEKDPSKIQAIYDLGVSDTQNAIQLLKHYLQA